MNLIPYKSVARYARFEQTINKSRFIAEVMPVEDEQAATAFLQGVKQAAPEASHHCAAYIVGARQNVQRFFDDGEPSGTAGMPILEVLKRNELTQIIAVVTRYFGGILLGAGGLVRAYASSCAGAIEQSGISLYEHTQHIALDVPYTLLGSVENYLTKIRHVRKGMQYGVSVTVELYVKLQDCDVLQKAVAELSGGMLVPQVLADIYFPWA